MKLEEIKKIEKLLIQKEQLKLFLMGTRGYMNKTYLVKHKRRFYVTTEEVSATAKYVELNGNALQTVLNEIKNQILEIDKQLKELGYEV